MKFFDQHIFFLFFRLPNISLRLDFSKSKEEFFLLGKTATFKDKLKLEILDLEISLKTSRIEKTISDAHTRALAGGLRKALYPAPDNILILGCYLSFALKIAGP